MDLPEWIPEPITHVFNELARRAPAPSHGSILDRLATDERMKSVYTELFRRDRKTGDFLNPAQNGKGQSAQDAQVAAIQELLELVVSAANDRVPVTKPEEIEKARLRWHDDAKRLRALAHDLELAVSYGQLGTGDPLSQGIAINDFSALLRVANWLDHLCSVLRKPDDPLMIERDRGDPVVRGVQILIAVKLAEQFGKRLDGIAATLTSVALDTKVTTGRTSRSALARRKSSDKADSKAR